MPNTAVISDAVAIADGSEAQPGTPDQRSDAFATRPSRAIRPLRWPKPRVSRIAVMAIADTVAIAISAIAAPPAGGAEGDCAWAAAGRAASRAVAMAGTSARRGAVMAVLHGSETVHHHIP